MAADNTSLERSNISGLVLHVDEFGEQAPESLTYHKSDSRTVVVGRKSSQGMSDQPDPERALFRCPVVSRKHAKITFTEHGNVYITDLHSHHGTHILRPGELVSTSLKPEVPTVLADGDQITFGKSVGRDYFLVRPVVARVEMIFGGDAPQRASSPSPRSFEALYSIPGPDADDSQSQPHERDIDKTPARASTGRYGVFLPSPESSSSSSDGDSDIQEISPPSSPQHDSAPSFPRRLPFGSAMSIPLGARLRLLQQILPPIHIADSPEPEYYPPPIEPFSLQEIHVEAGVVEGEEDMDLSSSRASSPLHDDPLREEPSVVGAWPHTPARETQSPESRGLSVYQAELQALLEREVIEISDDDYGTPSHVVEVSHPVGESEKDRPAGQGLEVEMADAILGDVESVQSPVGALPVNEGQDIMDLGNASMNVSDDIPDQSSFAPVHAAFQRADASVVEVQISEFKDTPAIPNDESVFTAHVEQTKARLDALETRVQDTQTDLDSRTDELSSIHTRLQVLKDFVSGLQGRTDIEERLEELTREVGAAKVLLQESCTSQHQTREQIASELEAIKALRAEVTASVAEARLAIATVQAAAIESSTSLKRKREEAVNDESVPANLADVRDLQSPPAPKRRRAIRVASTIAQTATVASLGAAAAWVALAFS
ncbi:hypothetical protein DICSQDRAFT_148514 [Dichomitus squalens LYAD-421 SS1]|uniref:FHA domain-containing protein n=1 Tax=Dichomitus squalens (strain LYAD-421) TaxID=732165 RepID=R7SUK0_DICSQ|nr:uncharacterized protein DICSQDRAFT_148514 [Dichomitus squalens LYAD-421 SS1]EJF59445.1 hypothetical protein DICSQDRAFT_148514 [Dichomitus squalens LYAD-421 SS1]